MPRQKPPISTAERFARQVSERLDAMAPALAERLGPAPGTDRYGGPEVARLWDTPDNSVDQHALFQALQQGITPEGAQQVALFRMAPKLAQAVVGKPVPPEQAAAIAQLAQHPGRYVLTAAHSPDAAKQVAFVEQMHRRAAKRQQQTQQAESPAPSVPAAPQGGY